MKSLYIHIPFCERKCFYCSFPVSIGQNKYYQRYLNCLFVEMDRLKGNKIKTVYLGGGTPSALTNFQLEKCINEIKNKFVLRSEAEWTAEVNPEHIDFSKAECIMKIGINRISLGIQSFNNDNLRFLGRNHTAQQARQSIKILQSVGFKNINVDLMFGFQPQSEKDIQKDLRAITGLGVQHISIYSLSIEPNSRFYVQGIDNISALRQAAQYVMVKDELESAGYRQYEISNFARKGFESRHNINYWEEGEYWGLGMGAHSFINGRRYWNVPKLKDYLFCLENNRSPEADSEKLDCMLQFKEAFLFGLRMNRGVAIKRLEKRYHCSFSQEASTKINLYIRRGFLIRQDDRIQVTDRGRLVLDEISSELI